MNYGGRRLQSVSLPRAAHRSSPVEKLWMLSGLLDNNAPIRDVDSLLKRTVPSQVPERMSSAWPSLCAESAPPNPNCLISPVSTEERFFRKRVATERARLIVETDKEPTCDAQAARKRPPEQMVGFGAKFDRQSLE